MSIMSIAKLTLCIAISQLCAQFVVADSKAKTCASAFGISKSPISIQKSTLTLGEIFASGAVSEAISTVYNGREVVFLRNRFLNPESMWSPAYKLGELRSNEKELLERIDLKTFKEIYEGTYRHTNSDNYTFDFRKIGINLSDPNLSDAERKRLHRIQDIAVALAPVQITYEHHRSIESVTYNNRPIVPRTFGLVVGENGLPEGILVEKVPGETFYDIIQKRKLSVAQVSSVVREVEAQLQVLHEHQVLHGDLHVGNVMVDVQPTGKLEAHLIDFTPPLLKINPIENAYDDTHFFLTSAQQLMHEHMGLDSFSPQKFDARRREFPPRPSMTLPTGGVLQIGANHFRASISGSVFEIFSAPATAGTQKQSNWCWAACIKMVLNYFGIPIEQEQIVRHGLGQLVDQPGGSREIVSTLNNTFLNIFNRPINVRAKLIDPTQAADWVQLIANRIPIIVGLAGSSTGAPGHAYVIKALDYSLLPNGIIIHSVTLADPFPSSPPEVVVSWNEFASRQMGAYIVF